MWSLNYTDGKKLVDNFVLITYQTRMAFFFVESLALATAVEACFLSDHSLFRLSHPLTVACVAEHRGREREREAAAAAGGGRRAALLLKPEGLNYSSPS